MSSIVYKLSTTAPPGGINLKPVDWRILTQVNGTRSVSDIAQSVGMDVGAVTHITEVLYDAGVLEVAAGVIAAKPITVDQAFMDRMVRELARAMGPLADLVVDDEIEKLGEKRGQFPRDRIPDLVECVSVEIRDDSKRLAFQQVMLDAIRKL